MFESIWPGSRGKFEEDILSVEREHRVAAALRQLCADHELKPDGELQEETPDFASFEDFAHSAIVTSVTLVLSLSGLKKNLLSFEQRFVVGLFAFLMAHEVSKRYPVDLGVVLASVALELFSKDDLSEIYTLGRSYRRLNSHKVIARELHRAIGAWFDETDQEHLDELVSVFKLCCSPN